MSMDVEGLVTAAEEDMVALVLVNSTNFREVADTLTADLLAEGFEGIFFTADRTSSQVRDELEFREADASGLSLLDVVSKKRGLREFDPSVEAIGSPNAFNDINIAFEDLSEGLDGEKKFLLLDSFTSYVLYSNRADVGRFVARLADKCREKEMAFFVLAVEEQLEEEVREDIEKFVDEVVDLS